MTTTTADVRLATEGPVAVLTLARPEKRNALSDGMVRRIEEVFRGLDPEIRAVLLEAEGDHFCAGLDLSEMGELDVIGGFRHSRGWHRCFSAMEESGVAIVAALQGAVVGGGLELAATAHIRVADTTAFYALPEGQRGLFVGGGGSVRVPRLVGTDRMVDMMLTGRRYDAVEGERLGFSQYVVEAGTARDRALEVARRAAGVAPQTLLAVTQVLPLVGEVAPREGLVMESLAAALASSTDDAKGRMADFLAGRAKKVTDD